VPDLIALEKGSRCTGRLWREMWSKRVGVAWPRLGYINEINTNSECSTQKMVGAQGLEPWTR
jgi:hypothetical protein